MSHRKACVMATENSVWSLPPAADANSRSYADTRAAKPVNDGGKERLLAYAHLPFAIQQLFRDGLALLGRLMLVTQQRKLLPNAQSTERERVSVVAVQ